MNFINEVILIGCGNIGQALLKAWVSSGIARKIHVIQPSLSAQKFFAEYPQVCFYPDRRSLPLGIKPDAQILAFKPQQLSEVTLFQYTLNISLLSGTALDKFPKRTVRVMPNMGVQVGQGASLAFGPDSLSADDRELVDRLFGCTGKIYWIPSETHQESLTPIS